MKLEKKHCEKKNGALPKWVVFFLEPVSHYYSPFLPGHKSLIAHQPCCIFFGYTTPSFEVTQFCFNGFRSLNKIFHHFFSIITITLESWDQSIFQRFFRCSQRRSQERSSSDSERGPVRKGNPTAVLQCHSCPILRLAWACLSNL